MKAWITVDADTLAKNQELGQDIPCVHVRYEDGREIVCRRAEVLGPSSVVYSRSKEGVAQVEVETEAKVGVS